MVGVGTGILSQRRYGGFPPPLRSFWQRVRDDGGTMYDFNAAIAAYRSAPTASIVWAAAASKEGVDYSVLPADGSGDFTYSGGGNAVSQRPDGTWQINWPANTPRNRYDNGVLGRIVEPQRQNLISYPRLFSNAAWTKSGATVTGGFDCPFVDANGVNTKEGYKLVEDTSNGEHRIISGSISFVTGSAYSVSFFTKKNTDRYLNFVIGSTGIIPLQAVIKLSDGSIFSKNAGSTVVVETYPDDIFRITVSATALQTITNNIRIGLHNKTTDSYTGNGTSYIYLSHIQVEVGATSTSPIYGAEGGLLTRNADDDRVVLPSGVTEVELTDYAGDVTIDASPADPYVMPVGSWKKIIMT